MSFVSARRPRWKTQQTRQHSPPDRKGATPHPSTLSLPLSPSNPGPGSLQNQPCSASRKCCLVECSLLANLSSHLSSLSLHFYPLGASSHLLPLCSLPPSQSVQQPCLCIFRYCEFLLRLPQWALSSVIGGMHLLAPHHLRPPASAPGTQQTPTE